MKIIRENHEEDLETLAYAMVESYRITNTSIDAIRSVLATNPQTDIKTLKSMWHAIDAYVDVANSEDMTDSD